METKLKAVRAGHKGGVTRLLRKLEDFKQKTDFKLEELMTLLESLLEKQKFILEINGRILDTTAEDDVANEMEETDEYMYDLETQIKLVKKFVASHQTPQTSSSHLNPDADLFSPVSDSQHGQTSCPPSSDNVIVQTSQPATESVHNPYTQSTSNTFNHNLTSVSRSNSQSHRLPKLDLPYFDGDILTWQTFWDAYESTIHSNDTLTEIQKFSYLKAQLRGIAIQSIEGFPLTNANYETAIDLLTQRFGQPHKIVNAYMKALMNLPPPCYDLGSLRHYGDKLEAYVRGLESLGQSQDMYGALLTPVVLEKLPLDVRRNIARDNGSDNITLIELRKAIMKEVSILEVGHTSQMHESNSTVTFFTGAKSQTKTPRNTQMQARRPCIFCEESHIANDCQKVTDAQGRVSVVRQKKLCFNCLGSHKVKDCKSQGKCRKCQQKHHTSLCGGKFKSEKQESTKTETVTLIRQDETTESVLHSATTSSNVMLKTEIAPVQFQNNTVDAHIFLDEGAQRSFITEALARQLNVNVDSTETIQLSAFGDTNGKVRHLKSATISLIIDNEESIPLHVLVVPNIATPMKSYLTRNIINLPHLKGLKLAHPLTGESRFEVSLLIGSDFYWDVVGETVIKGNGPTAVSSRLGYLLSGPVTSSTNNKQSAVYLNIVSPHRMEDEIISNFWRLEALGIKSEENDDDLDYLQKYQKNSIQYNDGRYSAKLPWKPNHTELPTNYTIARARTESSIRRLSREPKSLETYTSIIEEQVKRGFIEKVEHAKESDTNVHYIPHHAVKKDSTTTPIRIVYDCSCRQSPDHASLNDCLMSVPPVTNDLTKLLMKFRLNTYAVSTDIEKAFLHVQLDEKDRDMTRFLWLSDSRNPDSSLNTYRFKSVLFGATCSPFILNATLLKHLDAYGTPTALSMKDDLYVDNILTSLNTENELIQYFKEGRSLMSEAGFNLRAWASNSALLRDIANRQEVLDKDVKTKVLGLRWDTNTDKLSFCDAKIDKENEPITKREILRQSSRIYDPLGLLGPVTVRAKALLQDLWKRKFEWDESLPDELSTLWRELASDLKACNLLVFDRHYFNETSEHSDLELHIFVDASLTAYGAVAYICNGTSSCIVMAKNRIAPLKTLTLPRLELMAALIGSRLAQHVMEAIKFKTVVYWSDSQIVLHWLNTTKSLKRFVQNRINEIKSITGSDSWKYCPTSDNPADLQTRGLPNDKLKGNRLWFKGPTWLCEKDNWPTWNHTNISSLVCNLETSCYSLSEHKDQETVSGVHQTISIDRFSTFRKLIRTTAYVVRFVNNCRHNTDRKHDELTVQELQKATELWILSAQQTEYSSEIENLKSNTDKRANLVKQLRLYLDPKSLLRCGGRIHNAPLEETAIFPYLLPRNHTFTKLLVMDTHLQLHHAGMQGTVTHLRQTYWIPCIRQCVNAVIHRCLICRKYEGKPYKAPDPAPLPKTRLTKTSPFTVTGVDYTGALYVKDKLNGLKTKVYICLFTCACTRAIHLELVNDLTEDSFLLAFRRFTSRKSLPRIMISDNATTFQAASETLEQLTKSQKVISTLANYGTSWQFIPKRAPWYGGFWERMIGITKSCLRKTIGQSFLTYDMLQTVLVEVEAIINDRPLTYISPNFEDEEPLTPAHLLYGRRITPTPYPLQDIDMDTRIHNRDLCKRAQFQRQVIEHFWNRWRTEYLTSLREFHRTTGDNKRTISVGDVVHIQEDKPRNAWKLATVEELVVGNDGHVRAAVVKSNSGRTSRPIVKLYPVELNTQTDDPTDLPDDVTRRIREVPLRDAYKVANERIYRLTHQGNKH